MSRNDERETRAPSLFKGAISKIAVAQICQYVGFTGSQHSALEALSDIATRYMEALAKSASSKANSCCRTECNLYDVIHGIEVMNSVQGFPGASEINKSLLDSAIIKDIMSFVSWVDEIPFAKPIPRSNKGKRSRVSQCLSEPKEGYDQNRGFSHIPSWLPALPDPSTYKNSEAGVRREEKNDWETNGVVDVDGYGCEKGNDLEEEKRVLPIERAKVRFKMELGLRNGICRGNNKVKGLQGKDGASKIRNKNRKI
ncbi:transcription initiation factor TFIID subunit 8 [Macadamia integrifolia]|uniref:transcription initiation factor TFIID subunit 8 n=1 Tax=Macadamia integrifolia TaxID=60698 RepID=UPI001C5296A4|nr:transcription initiation factor TFIID subunit 8 [Macadamia integrifolia]